MGRALLIGMALAALAAPPALAEFRYTRTLALEVESAWVHRGLQRAEETAILRGELEFNGYYGGLQATLPFGADADTLPDEGRFWLGWTPHVLEPMILLDLGLSYYAASNDGARPLGGDRVEAYGGMELDVPLSPAVYAYYDFENEATAIEGGVLHFVTLPNLWGVELGVDAGWVGSDDFIDYGYVTGQIDLVKTFTHGVEAFAGLRASTSGETTFFETFGPAGPVYGDDAAAWLAAGLSARF